MNNEKLRLGNPYLALSIANTNPSIALVGGCGKLLKQLMTGTSGITTMDKKSVEGSGLVTATGFTVDHLSAVINFVLYMVHTLLYSLQHILICTP